jgi:hypothetical protein
MSESPKIVGQTRRKLSRTARAACFEQKIDSNNKEEFQSELATYKNIKRACDNRKFVGRTGSGGRVSVGRLGGKLQFPDLYRRWLANV